MSGQPGALQSYQIALEAINAGLQLDVPDAWLEVTSSHKLRSDLLEWRQDAANRWLSVWWGNRLASKWRSSPILAGQAGILRPPNNWFSQQLLCTASTSAVCGDCSVLLPEGSQPLRLSRT